MAADDDPADHAELADSLPFAFLHLPERLDPVERAAFLLREVFGHEYVDVAATLDRSRANCRQIVHRAKERLDPDRPARFDPGPDEERRLVDSFLATSMMGDLDTLRSILTEDVIVWNDGGAKQRAARRPVLGIDRVITFVRSIATRKIAAFTDLQIEHARINDDPGVLLIGDGEVFSATAFELRPDGIASIYTIINTDKLAHLEQPG